MERTNTNSNDFPKVMAGKYAFTVLGRPEKKKSAKGNDFYVFKLSLVNQTKEEFKFTHCLFVNAQGTREFLMAIGGSPAEDDQAIIEWDRDNVEGKTFVAELIYETDKNGKEWQRIKNFEDKIPF